MENPLIPERPAMDEEHTAIMRRYLTPFLQEMQWDTAQTMYTHARWRLPEGVRAQVPSWSELSEEDQEAYIAQFWWA